MIDQRRHARLALGIEVWFDTDAGQVIAVSRDLSLGGMFIVTNQRLEYGTKFSLNMNLPSMEEPAVVDATVRWVGEDGVGVQFGLLRARETWAINQLLAGRPARISSAGIAMRNGPAYQDEQPADARDRHE